MVLPQAKATANRNFSNARNAPVAKAFTKFCKILEALNRREWSIGWTEPGLRSTVKNYGNFYGALPKCVWAILDLR